MSIRTTLSIWNEVEIASPGANRSIAHSRSASGSSPSNSIESSPASSSSISSYGAHSSASSRCRLLAGSRPASSPSSSSLARRVNAVEALARLAPVDPPGDQPLHRGVELVGRDAPEQRACRSRARARGRRGRRCRRPGAAPRPRRARSSPGSPGRRPSAARRRGGSRRDGAAGRRSPSRSAPRAARSATPSRVFVSATEKLQCGSPVQAIELPRTGLTSSGKPISLDRGPSPRRPCRSGSR